MMSQTLSIELMTSEQNRQIAEVFKRERTRLRNFIRRRVANELDAEEVLQDVFYELVQAYRLMAPVEQIAAWLFRVARNRITDLFRKKRTEPLAEVASSRDGEAEELSWEELLPSAEAGPEAAYARTVLLDELDAALEELPAAQRDVFVGHELEGRSFRDLAAETGVSVNTLLARKHYAVMHLRERLRVIYGEFLKAR